ncbi:MAG: two-component system, OmpR family, alkaline phosphatase synthesis response regulator PhoP [Cryptosporangiaceae bacterium]|jgi:CheY-like chemotaxis protein|nr:two-component system, OmpR family, alkaline phosphatase synthesis response regulator PhoP [Cryptosporangiaceae bacterium]
MADIVVAEDDSDIRMLIVYTVSRMGHRVTAETGTGLGALEAVRHSRPDLILTDHGMPEMTGGQLCQALHSDPATSRIPVIMLSATDDATARALAALPGVTAYLPKPFRPDDLASAVTVTLAASRDSQRRAPQPRSSSPG